MILRGYFTAIQVYFKIQEKYLKNSLTLHLKEEENKDQRARRRK